jgi:hypothetical protein
MAVIAVAGDPVVGVKYSVTTASSADWPSVSNSVYFYDLTDKLVHYKDANGSILDIFSAEPSVPQANTIYVDSVNGLDAATGRGGINKPYLTVEYVLSNTTNTGTFTATTANNNRVISVISDANNANLKVGQNIGGNGIPFNTVIISKGNEGGNANTITVSQPSTSTAAGFTLTWITSYRIVLSGNFTATSNWFKQGMYIDAQKSIITWGGFRLFSNTAVQIMPYSLLGSGNYYGSSTAGTGFFYFQAIQTADFTINLNYDIINTTDTGVIFTLNTTDGRCVIKGTLAKSFFGGIGTINTSKLTVYSSSYGLTSGWGTDNIASVNLIGGVHQTPSSVYVISGSISYFNSECTLYGSVSTTCWTHVGVLSGTTLALSQGSISASGGGTIYASGGTISTTVGNIGIFDLVVTGNVESHGLVRHVTVTSGILTNNGYINGDSPSVSGTLINNGFCDWGSTNNITLSGTSLILNFGKMSLSRFGIGGGTLENRGTIDSGGYSAAIGVSSGSLKNYGIIKSASGASTDTISLSGTGTLENYGIIQNLNTSTTYSLIKKSGGTLKLFFGSTLRVSNSLSPIWCVNDNSASKDIYMFNCITNCNGTSYGLGYAFPTGFVPNDLVGGIKYENVNY